MRDIERQIIENAAAQEGLAPQMYDHTAELAACLRGAVTAMELLDHYVEPDYTPGLPALIERSKQALLEYDK